MLLYNDRLQQLLDDFAGVRTGSGYPTIEQKIGLAQVYAILELAGQVAQLRQTLEVDINDPANVCTIPFCSVQPQPHLRQLGCPERG